jgi:hypothetical protein
VDLRGAGIARVPVVAQHHLAAAPPQHQGRAQPSRPAADDQDIQQLAFTGAHSPTLGLGRAGGQSRMKSGEGAGGETRTRKPVKVADFESAAYTISPLRLKGLENEGAI